MRAVALAAEPTTEQDDAITTGLWSAIEPEFLTGRSAAIVRELRFLFAVEAGFYPVMRELEASHSDVSVGSSPTSRPESW